MAEAANGLHYLEKSPVNDLNTLPQFKCHKVVRAGTIRSWYVTAGSPTKRDIYLEEIPEAITVPDTMFARYIPRAGDKFVVYDEGFQSISPKDTFDKGYAPL